MLDHTGADQLLSVTVWLVSLLGCIFYGAQRIHKTYKSDKIDRHENYKNGFALIMYSVLIVGVSGFLGVSIAEYQLTLPENSYFWVGIGGIADLTILSTFRICSYRGKFSFTCNNQLAT